LNIQGDVNISGNETVQGNESVCGSLSGCNGNPLNIQGDTNITGTLSICGGNLQISNVISCTPGTSIVFNDPISTSDINMCPATGSLFTSNIFACGGTVLNITGDTQINGNETVTGDLSVCTGNLLVNNVSSCDGTSPINFNSPVNLAGGISGDLNLCPGTGSLFTSNIFACGGTALTITGDTSVTGNLSVCTGNLLANNITSCDGTTPINFNSPVTFNDAVNITQVNVDNITPPSGTLTVNGNETVTGNLSVCTGNLQVANVVSCTTGTPINFNDPVNLAGGITGDLNLCPGTGSLFTSNIFACGGTALTITGDTTVTGVLSVCGGNLQVANVVSCTTGTPINFNDPVNFTQPITTTSITATDYNLTNVDAEVPTPPTSVSLLGPLVGPGGNTRSFKTLSSTDGSVTITDSPTNIDLSVSSTPESTDLFMYPSMWIEEPTPNTYYLQSVYGDNVAIVHSAPSYIVPKGTWTNVPLDPVTTRFPTDYFALYNTNFIGPVTSPTNSLEVPSDGYDGTFRVEIVWRYNIDSEFIGNGVDVLGIIIAPSQAGSPAGFGNNTQFITNLDQQFNWLSDPGGPASSPVLNGIISTGPNFFSTTTPYGIWLYYNGAAAPPSITVTGSEGGVTVYIRPYSR
jgi:hypothetical protein